MAKEIIAVDLGSIAHKYGIQPGENLCAIDGNEIVDVLDYQFYSYDKQVSLTLEKGGETRTIVVDKQEGEPMGLNFETYLIDGEKSCFNRCIFCFIDQNPPGMRESIYFKDDDARLSFLVGNYISLTNLSTADVDRIIKMRLNPLNISVHATDPAIRDLMLGNRFGGSSLNHLKRFVEAGLNIKTQIVVCPGVNDGAVLKQTLTDLSGMYPSVTAVSVVPVGITRYREGLYPLKAMDKACGRETLAIIDAIRRENIREIGEPLLYAADEIYLKADLPIPPPDYYGDYEQIENGVGLMALFEQQVKEELRYEQTSCPTGSFTIATGVDAGKFMEKMLDYCRDKWHNLNCNVVPIVNDFFGGSVTVAGLVTGGDILAQLKGKNIGETLLLPICMLRHKEDVFLDDVSIEQVEKELGVRVLPCEIDGAAFIETLCQGAK